jgi:hypothetical protein
LIYFFDFFFLPFPAFFSLKKRRKKREMVKNKKTHFFCICASCHLCQKEVNSKNQEKRKRSPLCGSEYFLCQQWMKSLKN